MTDRDGSTWTLDRREDGTLLAELIVTGGDFPWLRARIDARAELAEVRPLFVEELRLLDHINEDAEPWERAYNAILDAVTLRHPGGQVVAAFLLHLDGDEAWWRWSDEGDL